MAKPWIKTGMFSKWPSFRDPLEIPALAVPLVTVRGARENKGLAVESCWDEEAVEGKLLSLLRAEPDVQNRVSVLHEKWVGLRTVGGSQHLSG